MTMRIVHFSDFHLGIDTIGPEDPETGINGRVLDYLDMLDSMIEYSEEHEADLVVFAGDLFNRSNPSPTYVVQMAQRIVRLSKLCPVVLVVGNHDAPGSEDRASAIDVFEAFKLPNVIVGNSHQVHRVTTKNGNVQVVTFPYPFRRFIDGYKNIQDFCNATLLRLASELDSELPSIFVGHFSVDNALYGSEQYHSIIADAEVTLEDLVQEPYYPFDYVALGHLHLHQVLNEVPPVIYAGSLERVDFTEEKDKKGFVWVELDEASINWNFIEVDSRPFTTLRYDFVTYDISDAMKHIRRDIGKRDLVGHIVRVIIDIDADYAKRINIEELYCLLEKSWVRGIKINRIHEDTPRFGKIADNLISMPHIELVKAYFKELGIEPKKARSLVNIAKELMLEVQDARED